MLPFFKRGIAHHTEGSKEKIGEWKVENGVGWDLRLSYTTHELTATKKGAQHFSD